MDVPVDCFCSVVIVRVVLRNRCIWRKICRGKLLYVFAGTVFSQYMYVQRVCFLGEIN